MDAVDSDIPPLDTVVEVFELSRRFGAFIAVDRVTFTVRHLIQFAITGVFLLITLGACLS